MISLKENFPSKYCISAILVHYRNISTLGNVCAFETIDGFTKKVNLFSCKTIDAKEVIKHLTVYFDDYSVSP